MSTAPSVPSGASASDPGSRTASDAGSRSLSVAKSDAAPGGGPLLAVAEARLLGNYRPAPFVLSRGSGCELFDTEGRRYLDLCAGVAVSTLGHGHPRLAKAIAEQAGRLIHASNYFYNEENVRLADELCQRTGMDRAFFCNSGAEANEAMLKLARRHFWAQGQKDRYRIIAFHQSFHGRTMGALAVTGNAKYKEGFGPPLEGVTLLDYGDAAKVRAAMAPDVAAILVEPIQGEGGVLPPPAGYLSELRRIADEHGALLLVDEVQTGVGRTGAFLASDQEGVRGDAIALAKGLAGGVPIGVMLVKERVAGALPPGTHGSTFGGSPLACAAARTVLAVIDEEKLVAEAARKGTRLAARLSEIAAKHPRVCTSARGRGLLQAVGLQKGVDARALLAKLQARGVLLTIAGDALRVTPPLVIRDAELDEGLGILEKVVGEAAA